MRKTKFEVSKYYHIYNRGVDKRDIFMEDRDKWRFLQAMFSFNDAKGFHDMLFQIEKENNGRMNFKLLTDFINSQKNERDPLVRILADCLMPNHFHLLIEEIRPGGISLFMQKLCTGYACFFNKKYNRSGSLFQGPFKAVEIKDDIYLQHLLIYINIINPGQLVEPELKEKGPNNIEKILSFAEKYSFSTNPDYLGLRNSIIIDKGIFSNLFPSSEKYRDFAKNTLLSKSHNIIDNFIFE